MTDTEIFQLGSVGMLCTKLGLEVLAQGLQGAQILFSRVAIGDGILTVEDETDYRLQVLNLNSMINFKMNLTIGEIKNLGNGEVVLTAGDNNAQVDEGFFAREQAVFAIDPASGEEILYSYRNSGDASSFIPSNTGAVTKEILIGVHTIIQNAANVSAILDSSFAYVSRKDYYEHIDSDHPHLNTPNHYEDVSTTDNFWVTNSDSHLHKLNVSDTKKLLLTDLENDLAATQNQLYRLDLFVTAQNDLGLETNLLLVEDMTWAEVDRFSVKVLSYVVGGKSIGVESVDGVEKGATYWLCDDVNYEEVKVVGVSFINEYYRLTLDAPLANEYDLRRVRLMRTTFSNEKVDSRSMSWSSGSFSGVVANVEREVSLDYSGVKIEGDGVIMDNHLTLW